MGKTKAIREAVRAEFRASPLVDDTDITVENMKGDVTLTGVVTNYQQYLTGLHPSPTSHVRI